MRWNLASIACASDFIASVFAKPGTPSSKTCPLDSKPIINFSTIFFCPIIALPISAVKVLMNWLSTRIFSFNSVISKTRLLIFEIQIDFTNA